MRDAIEGPKDVEYLTRRQTKEEDAESEFDFDSDYDEPPEEDLDSDEKVRKILTSNGERPLMRYQMTFEGEAPGGHSKAVGEDEEEE